MQANYEAHWGADYWHLGHLTGRRGPTCVVLLCVGNYDQCYQFLSVQCTLASEAVRENQPRTAQCSVISGRCGGDVVLKLAPCFLTTSDALQG